MINQTLKALLPLMLGTVSLLAHADNEHTPTSPTVPHSPTTLVHGLENQKQKAPLDVVEHQREHSYSSLLFKQNATVNCDLSQFATNNAQQLINAIETQGVDCINLLFNADSTTQSQTYTSANMITASDRARTLSASYAGGGDENIESYFLFLRAGYYVEFYNDNVTFSADVKPSVKQAIDQFVANQYFYSDNDAHGKTLGEVIITMDSSEQHDAYLHVVKGWLSRWNQSYASKWYIRSAVNNLFTLLYRGQWNNQFVTNVSSDSELVSELRAFTMKSWMIGTDAEYLINNAGGELGRLKMYTGAPIQTLVDNGLNNIFSTYQTYGYGDGVWLSAADKVTYYANCADYGICGFEAEVEAKALSQSHSCSATIKVRSQNMNATQLSSACSTLGIEETRFHSMLQTNQQPVGNDYNDFLQINIFDSDSDYQKYAGVIFGINTNNGGMYLEGDPSVPGNQANFVAYEASYAKPDHYVWNLEHEYVHYLDGRFNLYGDFNAPTEPIVWWSEGSAEYVANLDNNQAAIDTIKDGSTYTLGEIFNTTYTNGDTDRIYRWGYLAVRFMFEKHPNEVQNLRAATRVGNWVEYKSLVTAWASSYGAEFTQWTQQLANQTPGNQPPVAVANGPYTGTAGQVIQFDSTGSMDPDGSLSAYAWSFGDGATSTQASPTHSYTSPGQYTVTLTVTDNNGATHSATTQASVNDGGGNNQLINGQAKLISGQAGSETVYQLDVPPSASSLRFTLRGGTGDADLYVKYGAVPTKSNYDCRPYVGGSNETCEMSNVQTGTYYVLVVGYTAYQQVSLTGTYTESASSVPDACATQGPSSGGELHDGQVRCLASQDPMWFNFANVSGHNSVAISVGNGSGDLKIEYSNSGWPSAGNIGAVSDNTGNSECIYLTNQSQYWGYIKVSGQSSGASIVVDYDAQSCR